jgi:hypothetical protein
MTTACDRGATRVPVPREPPAASASIREAGVEIRGFPDKVLAAAALIACTDGMGARSRPFGQAPFHLQGDRSRPSDSHDPPRRGSSLGNRARGARADPRLPSSRTRAASLASVRCSGSRRGSGSARPFR